MLSLASADADGYQEDLSQHLHRDTGWLSIDVINVLGAANLGLHVVGESPCSWERLKRSGHRGAFVNWNNQHWSPSAVRVLVQQQGSHASVCVEHICTPPSAPDVEPKDPYVSMYCTKYPIVAGFALTVNKAQGLTIKEGVVIHSVGSKRFRPASKHGLAFVAWTRPESFRMTAFKNLPAWGDFMKGKESDMLRMRKRFVERLQALHQNTLAANSDMKTAEQENAAYLRWKAEQEHDSKRARTA